MKEKLINKLSFAITRFLIYKALTHYKTVNVTSHNFPTEHSYNKYSQMSIIMTHVIFIITIRELDPHKEQNGINKK